MYIHACTLRQIQHLNFISQFISDIRHAKGAQNGPADALSHLNMNALHVHVELNVIIDFEELAASRDSNTELVQPKLSPSTLILRDMPVQA